MPDPANGIGIVKAEEISSELRIPPGIFLDAHPSLPGCGQAEIGRDWAHAGHNTTSPHTSQFRYPVMSSWHEQRRTCKVPGRDEFGCFVA